MHVGIVSVSHLCSPLPPSLPSALSVTAGSLDGRVYAQCALQWSWRSEWLAKSSSEGCELERFLETCTFEF